MNDKIIGLEKLKGVSKSLWENRIRKKGQGCPRKANGPRMPKKK